MRGAGTTLDAGGLLALPGIVDLHGDAFEHLLSAGAGGPLSCRRRAGRGGPAVAGERHHHGLPRNHLIPGNPGSVGGTRWSQSWRP
ncbi:MAG: hypothetical protein U5L11_16950 [Arhodomonas sp.]|nr:hypothetical protein [Arhodomonas sp.]